MFPLGHEYMIECLHYIYPVSSKEHVAFDCLVVDGKVSIMDKCIEGTWDMK